MQQGRPRTTSNDVDAGEVYPEVGDTFAGFLGFMESGVLAVDAAGEPSSSGLLSGAAGKKNAKGKSKRAPTSLSYVPASVPSTEEHIKVYTVGLAAADLIFSPNMCKDPLPMLAAVMGILSKTEESAAIAEADKKDVSEAIRYLAEWVATITALADPSAPSVNFIADTIPRGEGGRRRGPSRTLLFDVAKRLARRVPLTKLVALNGDIRPYLASLMVAALHQAGDKLVVPSDLEVQRVTRE